MDLWTFLEDRITRPPDKVLPRHGDTEQTYRGFHDCGRRTAGALHAHGVRAGDNVCFFLGNHQEYRHAWFGRARPGEAIDPVAIVQWCEERMADFMVPRYVEVRDALPKTTTERVEKYKLKREGIGRAWDREAAGYRVRRERVTSDE